jgi:cytoskeletal protein RodZ
MNGFTKKRVGTMTLGERLKKLRGDKRISLNDVARATKIRIDYLENLEEGNYEKLPVDVYVKGFLRSYAEFLGVEEDLFIRLFEKEKGIKKNIEKKRSPRKEKSAIKPVDISSFVFTPKKVSIILVVVLFLAGFIYLYREIGSFSSAPQLVILSPDDNAQVKGNSIYIEGATDKDAKLFINNQPILVNDDGKFRENVTVQPGVNVLNVRSVNRFNKETDQKLQVQADYEEKVAGDSTDGNAPSDNSENSPEQNNSQLQIELRVDPGPVWLSVEADDNLVFSGTMLSGATQVFKAQNKILINSGRANATFAKFNGKDIGALGTDAKAVRGVVFTKDTKY